MRQVDGAKYIPVCLQGRKPDRLHLGNSDLLATCLQILRPTDKASFDRRDGLTLALACRHHLWLRTLRFAKCTSMVQLLRDGRAVVSG